jgi:integrase
VEETAKGMIWRFGPKESKNHKERIVYVAPEIADIVRGLLKKYPPGQPLFRNSIGQPWTMAAIRRAFHRLRRKLTASGIKLDDAGCMYTCRHTFAKRTLGGYWTAKPCTIEQLCKAMGNSRQVCWDHYAQWSNDYVDPIWEAINGKPIETNQSAITEAVSPAIPN